MKLQNFIFTGIAICTFIINLTAETNGVISDDVIIPQDLHTFNPPPGAGSFYIDPAFGTKITRVTDNSRFGEFVLGGYFANSEICYFNKDGSYFLAAENDIIDGQNLIGTYIYNGHTGTRIKYLGLYGSTLGPYWLRWALADKYKQNGQYVNFDPVYCFYKYEGNELRLYDVRDIENYKIIRKFNEYGSIGPAGGEGDISHDGRYWCLDGNGTELFVYDLIDNIKYPSSNFDLGSLGSKGGNVGVDYARVSVSGKYVVVSWGTEPGAGKRYAGIELYDKNWNFIRQLHPSIVHWELGIDTFGDEVMYTVVTHDFPGFYSSCGATPGDIISVRLTDGHPRLLKDIPNWAQMSMSVCNSVTTGDYIYVSYHDRSDDPYEYWAPFWGEIIEIPTDGSQAVRRFVHNRTHYVSGQSSKYYQADAVINRQGSKIMYRSTYNNGIGDIYMFDILPRGGVDPDTIAPNKPENLNVGEKTEHTLELLWQRPDQAADGDYPSYYKIFRDDIFIADVYDTRYVDFGLDELTTYHYKVYAVDDAQNPSEQAEQGSFSTLGDISAPELVWVKIKNSKQLSVLYSESVEQNSATTLSNYYINNNVDIYSAELAADNCTVLLSTTEMELGIHYSITINSITDLSKNQNKIADNTTFTFSLLPGFYDDFENGIDPAWVFHTSSRWSLFEENDNSCLFLNTTDFGDASSKLLGEYALVSGSETLGSSFRITVDAKSGEDLLSNTHADYAVVFGYVDDLNYYYVQFHPSDVKLHRMVNGERTLFEEFFTKNHFDELSKVAVELDGDTLRTFVENEKVFDYILANAVSGQIGVGSYNDSAFFDNVNIGSLGIDNDAPQAPKGLTVSKQ